MAGVVPVPAPAQVGPAAGQLPAIIGLLKAHLAVAPHLEEQSTPFGVVVRRVIIGGQDAGAIGLEVVFLHHHDLVRQLRRQGGQPALQGNPLLGLNGQVGHELPALPALPQGDLLISAAQEGVVVGEAHQLAAPLPAGEGDGAAVIGVAVVVEIHIEAGQIGKVFQPHLAGLRQGEAQILLQHLIHLGGGQDGGRAVGGIAALGGQHGRLQGHRVDAVRWGGVVGVPVAAVEELEQVDLLRRGIGGAEELVADVQVVPVEKAVSVEVGQLLLRERLPGVAPPAGEGAPHRQPRQEDHRRQDGGQGSGLPCNHGNPLL